MTVNRQPIAHTITHKPQLQLAMAIRSNLMPKRRNLKGLPHNLTKSYFGTMRYHGGGYMADWLLNAARTLGTNSVTLDIMNVAIDPVEMEKLPLLYHLKELRTIIDKELISNGFPVEFITEARIKVEIPDFNLYARTLYCNAEVVDKEGTHYQSGRIIETAYEQKFDPFEQKTLLTTLWSRIKKLSKKMINPN